MEKSLETYYGTAILKCPVQAGSSATFPGPRADKTKCPRHKTVFTPHVFHPPGIHLPGEPFSAVDADVYRQREPGLQPNVHESQLRVEEVKVMVQTLGIPQTKLQAFFVSVLIDVVRPARFDAVQHANQPAFDAVLFGNLSGPFFFACAAAV